MGKQTLSILEKALSDFNQCNIYHSHGVDALKILGEIYDELQIFTNSNRIWRRLIDFNPECEVYYERYIQSLKNSQQSEKMEVFLKNMDTEQCRVPVVYKELFQITKKKKKKEYRKKFEFYCFVPLFLNSLFYNEYSYKIFQKIKKLDGGTLKVMEKIFSESSEKSTEWIISILYNITKDQGGVSQNVDKDLIKELIEILLTQTEKRIKKKNLVELLLKLFNVTYHPTFTSRLVIILLRKIDYIRKNKELYESFFDRLVHLFFKHNNEINVHNAFVFLKDENTIPYLLNAAKFGNSELKKLSVLALSNFAKGNNKKKIVNVLQNLYENTKNAGNKIFYACALYKVFNDMVYLKCVKKFCKERKKVPDEIAQFLNQCENKHEFSSIFDYVL